ncbi:SAM dependent carboxyl methyltransferase [Melia azedarach]|uniref:SAM dependent carboxyl methyltransferase n=1 Tax=Melia azedarach TaxID=155640 RepID=A0ACC1X7C9_MELAZ|nr:SAM dependent carboxyl methyltransferase [Melia azedarach]
MASNKSNEAVESFPMNAGDGPYSYTHNSFGQKKGIDSVKALIVEGIAEKLETKPSQNIVRIADLGCSVGPNTFFAVEIIIESVKLKFQTDGIDSDSLEFCVFFNDHVSNDFNTLFKSIPLDNKYYAAGVPGSFHDRLFAKASLDFVHSSYALQWLSKVPTEIVDKQSPAWNKGKIYYTNSPKEVEEAYRKQFGKDIESFLNARATEIVSGGLMSFIIPGVPPSSKCTLTAVMDLMGCALMDLASMGLIEEEKVDSFNLPLYFPTPNELGSLIENNGYFSVENMEALVVHSTSDVHSTALHLRAGSDILITQHFGNHQIIEKLFDQFKNKIIESSVLTDPTYKPSYSLFVLLKRKSY